MGINKQIQECIERWFLSEPLLFSTFHTHELKENHEMVCPLRSGKGKVEYNPQLLTSCNDTELEILLRKEMLRILLKHPYQRQPLSPMPEILSLASEITIYQHSSYGKNPLEGTNVSLPEKLSFEEYYNLLLPEYDDVMASFPSNSGEKDNDSINSRKPQESISNSEETKSSSLSFSYVYSYGSDSSGSDSAREMTPTEFSGFNISGEVPKKKPTETLPSDYRQSLKDLSDLWQEDEWMAEKMNKVIENAMTSNAWGSVPGMMKELLEASIETTLNVIRQLGLFRASILSNERRLTRMRPNRRYGWDQMGIVHPYTTRLLVATDVSRSISNKDISRFFGVVNRFFRYGISRIDVLEFDWDIKLPVITLKKAQKKIKVLGRGGTSFQPVIDYFDKHKEYDGLIIFTDGGAPKPYLPVGRKVLWVLCNIKAYKNFSLTPKVYI